MSEKPVIFISHASVDKEYALLVKAVLESEIKDSFSVDIEVFVSSAPDAIDIGEDWFNKVMSKLDDAIALVVLATHTSIGRPWIWFEVGYFWKKREDGEGHIYPLCYPGVELPSPLNVLQSKSLVDDEQIIAFMAQLCSQLKNNGILDKFFMRVITEPGSKPLDVN